MVTSTLEKFALVFEIVIVLFHYIFIPNIINEIQQNENIIKLYIM